MKLVDIKTPTPFSDLAKDPGLCKEIQTILASIDLLPPSGITGVYNDVLINALVTFKRAKKLTGGNFIGATTAKVLLDAKSNEHLIITRAQFNAIYDEAPKDYWVGFNTALIKYKITSLVSLRHFMAQCGYESAGLIYMREIASGEAYEGRSDLGNIYPGDGRKYAGTGPIQATGRDIFQAFANSIGDQRVMEGSAYVIDNYVWAISAFWWFRNDMNSYCEEGATVKQVSRAVNGGTNGLYDPDVDTLNDMDDRYDWWDKVTSII